MGSGAHLGHKFEVRPMRLRPRRHKLPMDKFTTHDLRRTVAGAHCFSARGSDADWRDKPLKLLISMGSTISA
jgi:hypothetical protein